MCFIVRVGEKVRIASEDIVCWKVLRPKTSMGYGASFNGLIHPNHYYLPEELQPKVRLRKLFSKNRSFVKINKGYHSFTSKQVASVNQGGWEKVYEFIIPKGARYYKDPICSEYVSETIIMCAIKSKIKKSCA